MCVLCYRLRITRMKMHWIYLVNISGGYYPRTRCVIYGVYTVCITHNINTNTWLCSADETSYNTITVIGGRWLIEDEILIEIQLIERVSSVCYRSLRDQLVIQLFIQKDKREKLKNGRTWMLTQNLKSEFHWQTCNWITTLFVPLTALLIMMIIKKPIHNLILQGDSHDFICWKGNKN